MDSKIREIAENLLGRYLTEKDGMNLSEIETVENSLGIQLPSALRDFHLLVGNLDMFMKKILRLYFFIAVLGLTFFNTMSLQADGSPVVQGLAIKGDYLIINENSGIYMLKKKGEGFSWKMEEHVDRFFVAPDGSAWIHRQDNNVPRRYAPYISCFNGNEWVKSSYPMIKEGGRIEFFYIKNRTFLVVEEYDEERLVLYEFVGQEWKKITCFPEEYGGNIPSIYEQDDKCLFQPKSIPEFQCKSIPFFKIKKVLFR